MVGMTLAIRSRPLSLLILLALCLFLLVAWLTSRWTWCAISLTGTTRSARFSLSMGAFAVEYRTLDRSLHGLLTTIPRAPNTLQYGLLSDPRWVFLPSFEQHAHPQLGMTNSVTWVPLWVPALVIFIVQVLIVPCARSRRSIDKCCRC